MYFLDRSLVSRDDWGWRNNVVLGLRRDGRKQVLTGLPRPGPENFEETGAARPPRTRPAPLARPDARRFSGLLPITQRLFSASDIQLCTGHLQPNAKTHLHKADASEFQQRWRTIKSSWNPEVAQQQFEQLCDRFAENYSSFIAEVQFTCSYLHSGKVHVQVMFGVFLMLAFIFAITSAEIEMPSLNDPFRYMWINERVRRCGLRFWVFNRHWAKPAVLCFEELPPEVIITLGLVSVHPQ